MCRGCLVEHGSPLLLVSWQLVPMLQLSKHQCSISWVSLCCNMVQRAHIHAETVNGHQSYKLGPFCGLDQH